MDECTCGAYGLLECFCDHNPLGYGRDRMSEDQGRSPKIITICGSSRFVDMMAVCAWLLESKEGAIVMSLHLLPSWGFGNQDVPHHAAEREGVAKKMDALHLHKIEMSDEIYVVDHDGYIGESTKYEIEHAKKLGKPIRYYSAANCPIRLEATRRWDEWSASQVKTAG